MDSSFLPASQSEYSKQRTGMKFTVRSANSPTYSLSRKSCVRKQQSTEDVAEGERYGTHTGTNVTNKDDDTITGYESRTRSGSSLRTNKTIPDFGTERREKPAFESRGRSEWRASNLTSRSKSLDFRTGARSPDRCARADISQLSKKSGGDIGKQAGVLEGRRTRIEGGVQDRISSLQARNSAGASNARDRSQILENGIRGNTLPSRLRTLSASSCKCTETTFSLGSKAGQGILERIEKLYGPAAAGFGQVDDNKRRNSCNNHETSVDSLISPRQKSPEKTARGTLPLGFFSGETYSPVKSGKPFICTQKDTSTSGRATSFSPGISMSRESSPGWRTQGRYAEEGGVNWSKGFLETGTKSLDRARSRSSVAAQIRAARANQQPNVFSEETSDFLRDSSGFRVRKTNADDGANQMSELNSCEDVFEMNPQKSKRKTAASVRNKINQFEALTQRAQGLAPGPRRTFSVPAPVSTGHEGVKKSGSVTEIRELRKKWEGIREGEEAHGKAEDNVMGTGKKASSLDEVGLRIEKEQTGLNSLDQKGKNNCSENFDKHSRLRTTPEMSQRGGAVNGKLGTHETDFLKASSPEETASSTPAPLRPCGPLQWERTRSEITSPVSDDEQTPTNSPNHLLIASPMAQQGNDTPTADGERTSTPAVTHQTKTHDPDSRPRALATSSHSNLQDHTSPDVKTATPKGKKRIMDLNAWIAGLNPDLKVFSDDEDMDDDESTQKDEDSNYDSDSGGSSVTITSNMSQSDHRSFSLSLSDLCSFAGADYDSEIDSNDWQSADGRSASLSSDMSSFSCVSVLPTEELDKLVEEVRNLGDDALQDYNDVQVVVLHKEVGTGLGFSLAGGVDQNKPITVHKVFHTGVAAKQGSIKEGDQVLSINGTALSGSAHWEALRVLRRAKARDMVVVVLRRGDVTDSPKKGEEGNNQGQTQEQYETGHLVCVQLQKNSRDLGFSLEGGEGSSLGNRPLTVQKIFQGGPVDTVCPGDELLEIQGTSVVGMRRLEAWTLIRGLPPGPVEVLLRRCL